MKNEGNLNVDAVTWKEDKVFDIYKQYNID